MKKIALSILIFLSGSLLYFTKAQDIHFVDLNKQPIDGLIVSIIDITSGKGDVLITDRQGKISLKGAKTPFILQTYHFAFTEFRDTLKSYENRTITLQPNNVDLDEVSITGNYGMTDHSLFDTEVITREKIETQAANNVQDLFTHQLNTRVGYNTATGSNMTMQGINGENIKVLVDGVPVIGRINGNINLSQLNVNNVSRVEIIKGPASVLYGTNALGGVINIITDAGGNQPFKAGINSYYESNGQYNVDLFTNFHFKKTNLSLSGGRNFFEGWSETDSSRANEWNPKQQYFGNIRISQQLKKTQITFQSSYFDEKVTAKSGIIRGWPYEAYAFDEYYKTLRFNNNLQVNHIIDETHSLQMTGAYSHYRYIRNTYIKNLVDLSQSLSGNALQQDTNAYGAGLLRMVYTKDDNAVKINYQAGIDFNLEYTTGRRIKDEKQQVGDYAAFASIQYKPVESLVISPAVRIAYNSTYQAPVIPSLNLMYLLNLKTTFRASYSRGFRSPSLKEQYLDFQDANHKVFGNSSLMAENSHHLLASADWNRSLGTFNIKLSPSIFYNHIYNKIILVTMSDYYTYENLNKYITQGGQFVAGLEKGNLKLSAGIAYTGIYNQFENSNVSTAFTYSTEMNSSTEYRFAKTKTSLALYWKYNGHLPIYMLDENNNVQLFSGESYSMLDFSIVQPLFNNKITVGAGLKNILDVTSINNYQAGGAHQSTSDVALVGMGRSVFLRLQFQLSK